MPEPTLYIIAGCNGSGKSSFSTALTPPDVNPFDYDIVFLNIYRSLRDTDVRDIMAHNMAFEELSKQAKSAIASKRDFCYETNFNSTPLHWPELFKSNGYASHLIYLCLNSIEEAKHRVAIRVENGGHHVPEHEITRRYFDGFSNLNKHYNYFDIVDIFDASGHLTVPSHVLSVENGHIESSLPLPEYLVSVLPEIAAKMR